MHLVDRTVALVLFGIIAASGVDAQDVFVTAPNNKIIKVDFDTGATETVVHDRGTHFRALGVRGASGSNDLRIIATNKTRGGDIRIYDETTGAGAILTRFRKADGLALSIQGGIFATNRHARGRDRILFIPRVPGCADEIAGPFAPGCGPGGYGTPVFVDDNVPGGRHRELIDVRQARSNSPLFSAGQLLVLATNPAMVLGYSGNFAACDGDCEPVAVVPPGLIHHRPTGFAIAGDSLLIATKGGTILKVTSNGQVNVDEYFSLPGKGGRITVGADDGTLVAYATVPSKGGKVVQMTAQTQMGMELESFSKGIKVPIGVGTQSSGVVAAAAGSNVEVLLPQLNTTFTNLTSPGLFDGECKFYNHPDPGCEDSNSCSGFSIQDLDPSLPDVQMPAHFQPFRVGNAATGPLQYLICRVSSTAGIQDLITMIHEEETSIGYEPVCETGDTNTAAETRMAWAPIPGEDAPIVEGDQFIGITSGCVGSHRGFWKSYSLVSPIIRDLRSTDENIETKQSNLQATFDVVKDDIIGACPALSAGGGPGNHINAFGIAGLDPNDWSYVMTTGAFGATADSGNGWLGGGGAIEFQIRNAGFRHAFGTSDLLGETREVIIADSAAANPGDKFMYSRSGPYHFYFENIDTFGNPQNPFFGARAYTDPALDTPGLPVEVAVYRNIHDPREFALFFEDFTDNEFSDMVVTARGTAEDAEGTQCQLQLALAAGDAAVADQDYLGLLDALTDFQTVIDANPGDFVGPAELNTVGELKARAGAEIFQACKPIGGAHPSCPPLPHEEE